MKHSIGLVNFHSWKMQYILQDLYIRLILHNFCQAMVDVVSQRVQADDRRPLGGTQNERAPIKAPKSWVKIAFSKAVTICRKLLEDFTESAIASALSAIMAHTFVAKPDRSFARKVKPQSNRQFGYRAS